MISAAVPAARVRCHGRDARAANHGESLSQFATIRPLSSPFAKSRPAAPAPSDNKTTADDQCRRRSPPNRRLAMKEAATPIPAAASGQRDPIRGPRLNPHLIQSRRAAIVESRHFPSFRLSPRPVVRFVPPRFVLLSARTCLNAARTRSACHAETSSTASSIRSTSSAFRDNFFPMTIAPAPQRVRMSFEADRIFAFVNVRVNCEFALA